MATVDLLILFGELKLFLVVNAITENSITEIVQKNNMDDNSREFVKLIKEDLRRNNDDYLDSLPKNTSNPYLETSPTKATTVNKKQDNFKHNLINDTNRRALRILSLDSKDTNKTDVARKTEKNFPKRFNKITKSQPMIEPINKNKILANKHTKDSVDTLEKVKAFLENNKVLLKDFINKKKTEIITQTPKTTKTAVLRMRARDIIEDNTLPNDEQLDMAAAKGGRVHAMRIKGHLCQRNVLMPEGPKYDSKGNVYLGAFSPKPGQDYAKTIPPQLILPRCCNCCRKSVLGCE